MVERSFLVCVRCITYNHSDYIEDALNGFSMQQTDFPYVCVILDDNSTDGEQEILNSYLNNNFDLNNKEIVRVEETNDYILKFARHKYNKNCYFAVYFLKYNHYSIKKEKYGYIGEWQDHAKYIALCEGDDYWISPCKLQMQVQYMENAPDCSMCFHNAIRYYLNTNKVRLFNQFRINQDLSVHDAIYNWYVPTASIMVKQEYINNPDWLEKIYSNDYALILRCAHGGRIYGFKNIMSIYRINFEGGSLTAATARNGIFVINQHLQLLRSFDKGTNFRHTKEVGGRIFELEKELKFQELKNSKSLNILVNSTFWRRLKEKTLYLIIKNLSDEENI